MYSYWLSYRTGNQFSEKGLSIHMTYFELGDSKFGAWHKRMNYDANGYSDEKWDSFVTEGSCYHMTPPGYLLDRDIVFASEVQPVVCVDAINVGTSINVTVHFKEDGDEALQAIANVEEVSIPCSTQSHIFDSSNYSLLHVNGMGEGGNITLGLSSTSGFAGALFFDEYVKKIRSFNVQFVFFFFI